MVDVIDSYKWFEMVFDNIPTVLCNCDEVLLAKIPSFMLPLHKIKLSPSESLHLHTPSKAEKFLLSLIKQFPDPPLPSTSPTMFNFTYTVVKSKTHCSPVDHGCEKKSKPKESTVSSSSLQLLNFLEVNTCFTKAIVASKWILFTPRISGWKNFCIQRWNCWSFIQKLHFIQIDSCHFGYLWTTAFLHKLTMTIWNLWQYQNDVLLPADNGLAAVAWRPPQRIIFCYQSSFLRSYAIVVSFFPFPSVSYLL